MNWWSPALTALMWAGGIVIARRRGVPTMAQVLFTLVMFGIATGDLLFEQGMFPALSLPRALNFVLWLAVLVAVGRSFYKRGMTKAYAPLAVGISIVFICMLFEPPIPRAISYPLYGLALLLALVSIPLTRNRG
jgi:hypothetical protein